MATEPQLNEHRIAAFFDFENIIQGVRDANYDKFRLELILDRLVEKGKIVFKRAYCDWSRFKENKNDFHEASIELIDIPTKRISGKNSADIRMVVDALDLCYQRDHITAFALISGDSDFSPLVNKLTEYNKHIIGIGVKNSTSELLVSACDEFIFYEDLVREKSRLRQQQQQRPVPAARPSYGASSGGGGGPGGGGPAIATASGDGGKQEELFELVMDAFAALQRENYDHVWGSMIKQQIKRKKPQFTEAYFGFRNFSDVLEAAKKSGLVDLKRDQRSGSYVVLEIGGGSGSAPSASPASSGPPLLLPPSASAGSSGSSGNSGNSGNSGSGSSGGNPPSAPPPAGVFPAPPPPMLYGPMGEPLS
ncbi:MAG: NYN domain-containing protein [Planctomycetes bacterium]|nr:NYN domain-containing protein [Planctomycetota bacterium]